MTTTHTTETLIIGAGFSGLYLAQSLLASNYKNFLVIAPDKKTVSDKSYYNFRSRGVRQQSLKDSIATIGHGKNNRQLVNILINNIDNEITKLSRLTPLKPSYFGAQVVNPVKFLSELKQLSREYRIFDEVITINKNQLNYTVISTKGTIICRQLVLCAGGSRSDFSPLFKDEKVSHNIFSTAQKLGCQTKYLNKIMYYPFYKDNICIPSDNLADFTIVSESGKKLEKTNELLEAHNAHHQLEQIVKEMKKEKSCFALKGKQKIKIKPAPHYRLGGIVINKYGRTNLKNVFALGECSFGLHGFSRLGGCALSEILVMANIISKQIIFLDAY